MRDVRPELTEKAFRRWEEVLARAVSALPDCYQFVPEGIRVTTAVSRIRDAILSYRLYGWGTTIDAAKFRQYGLVVRNLNDQFVELGPAPELVKKSGKAMFVQPTIKVNPASLTDEALRAICLLVANGLLLACVTGKDETQVERVRQVAKTFGLDLRQTDEDFVIV